MWSVENSPPNLQTMIRSRLHSRSCIIYGVLCVVYVYVCFDLIYTWWYFLLATRKGLSMPHKILHIRDCQIPYGCRDIENCVHEGECSAKGYRKDCVVKVLKDKDPPVMLCTAKRVYSLVQLCIICYPKECGIPQLREGISSSQVRLGGSAKSLRSSLHFAVVALEGRRRR